jgi:hypothetical protein
MLADKTPMSEQPLGTLQRPLHDLRISVTDRCSRCVYCMPKEIFGATTPSAARQLLTFEELERAGVFHAPGRPIQLTGGELRRPTWKSWRCWRSSGVAHLTTTVAPGGEGRRCGRPASKGFGDLTPSTRRS